MAGNLDVNPDVPVTSWGPDVQIAIDTAPVATSSVGDPKRVLVLSPMVHQGSPMTGAPYNQIAGLAQPNTVLQYTSSTKTEQAFNKRSGAATRWREAYAQVPSGIDVFVAPVQEASGSGFSGFASALITVIGTAVGAGEIMIWLCNHLVRVPVASGDTDVIIAGNILAQIPIQAPYAPLIVHPALLGTATVGLAYINRGEIGNDRPIRVQIPSSITGVALSPGTITVATNAAAGGSVFTLNVGSYSLPVAIPGAQTPANSATAIAAAINAATFPLRATVASNVVTLLYGYDSSDGWVVHRISVASTEATGGQTYTLADRHDHASPTAAITSVATVPATATATALAGSGTPNLTAVLANIIKDKDGFLEWVTEFIDPTSARAITTATIEIQGNGANNKSQRVTFASSEPLDTARSRVTGALAPSPDLTGYWRSTYLHGQDLPMQAVTAAAMLAAALAVAEQPKNFDGFELLSQDPRVPIAPSRQDVELSDASRDVAMRSYHMTPLIGVRGRLLVQRGVTTWGAINIEWADFSFGRCFDRDRSGMRRFLASRFAGKVYFSRTEPRIPDGFTDTDVADAVIEYQALRDGITIDGADSLRQFVKVRRNPTDGSRLDITYRQRPPRELHKLVGIVSEAA